MKVKRFPYIIINWVSYAKEIQKVIDAIKDKKYGFAIKRLERVLKCYKDGDPCVMKKQWIS